jgi:PAS domain S-box-containing protein
MPYLIDLQTLLAMSWLRVKSFIPFLGMAMMVSAHVRGGLKRERVGFADESALNSDRAEEPKNSLALMETILECTDNGILVTSLDGMILKVNSRFTAMWGIPADLVSEGRDDMMVRSVLGRLSDPEEFRARVKAIYSQPAIESVDLLHCKDGHVFERSSRPLLVAGSPAGIVWSFRDISDRLVTEQSLRDAQRRESLGILSGGIAHDYNNLLGSMIGYVSLAQAQLPSDHPSMKTLDKALMAMDRAAILTRQILAYAGKGKYQIRMIDLVEEVRQHASLFKVSLAKNVTLITQLPSAPVYVSGDPGQIEQIIRNLVVNGGEAIGENTGTVTVTLTAGVMGANELAPYGRLTMTHFCEGNYARLEVTDNGAGMRKETMDKIFDPFFTTKFTGRGLGLSAVIGIVQGHKGGITVESKEGEGTTFSIILPLIRVF